MLVKLATARICVFLKSRLILQELHFVGGAHIDYDITFTRTALVSIAPPVQNSAPASKFQSSPSVGRTKAIADACFGQDVLWSFWINFDFLPELGDVDPEVLSVDVLIP